MNKYPNYHIFVELAAQRDTVIFVVALFTLILGIFFYTLQRQVPELRPAIRMLIVGGFYSLLIGGAVWSLLS